MFCRDCYRIQLVCIDEPVVGLAPLGNFGDAKALGDGISELKVDYGPGYRVYFTRRGLRVVLLLCGGDKSTQSRDIAAAKAIAAQFKE